MPPCWLVVLAAVLVVPLAVFIRMFIRPTIAAIWMACKTQLAMGEWAEAGDAAFAAVLRHPLWLKSIVWAGSLSVPAAIALVVACALGVYFLSAALQSVCGSARSSGSKFRPTVRRTTTPASPTGQGAGDTGKDGLEMDLDPAQAEQWDKEMAQIMADLRAVEAQLGLPSSNEEDVGEEHGQEEADVQAPQGALRRRPVSSQAPQ